MGYLARGAACLSIIFALLACSEAEISRCRTDATCGADAVCAEGFCVHDPLPRPNVKASHSSAAIGEIIELDLRESYVPGGGKLEFEVFADPEEAVEWMPSKEEGVKAARIVLPHTNILISVVATTATGREAALHVPISPKNTAPSVHLSMGDETQPGEKVELSALVEDPDGDELAIEWFLERGPGKLSTYGDRATLVLDPDEPDAWYGLRVAVTDGLEEAEASVSFQAENLPPKITRVQAPSMNHQCDDFGCSARTRLEVEAEDFGPLSYRWFYLPMDESPMSVAFETSDREDPLLVISGSKHEPIAGKYRLDVEVKDAHGASSSMRASVEVRNRPPVLQAHDGSVLHHKYLGSGQLRWTREPGGFEVWSDPDGNLPKPGSISWSSLEPLVEFSDPSDLDPSIEIVGGGELLDRSISIQVEGEDINGAKAVDVADLVLGNRAPQLLKVTVWPLDDDGSSGQQLLSTVVWDPDSDPYLHEFTFTDDEGAGLAFGKYQSDLLVAGHLSAVGKKFTLRFEAEDIFGARTVEERTYVFGEPAE